MPAHATERPVGSGTGPADSAPNRACQVAYLLALFTLLAAVLRAINLNNQLWCDEIVTVVNAVRLPTWELVTSYFYDNQHTLYVLLAQVAAAVFGEHPWTVRLPAMLCGTASVPVLYLLAREFTSRFEALSAAGLLAVSYHHIWFSQNARGYTALMLAALFATWCFVRGLKGAAWRPWLLYAVIVALGAYTHATMVFLAVSHATLYGLMVVSGLRNDVRRIEWWKPLAAFALAGALTLLLYAPMLPDFLNFYLHKPTGMKAVSTPGWALTEAWNMLVRGFWQGSLVEFPLLLGAISIIGCGLASYARQDRLILGLLVLPALVTLCAALAVRGTLYPRFFFYLAGFGLLVGIRGIAVLLRGALALPAVRLSPRLPQMVGTALVALLMVGSAASLGAYYRYPKQDFEGAIALVERQRAAGEPVVTAGTPASFCLEHYYQRPWEEARSVAQIESMRSAGRPVWLVYTMPRYLQQEHPELAAMIRDQFTVERELDGTLGGGAVLVCRSASPGSGKPAP